MRHVIVIMEPGALDAHTAAEFLSVSDKTFRRLCADYPDRLRPFNYAMNGDVRWSADSLKAFRDWRESIGIERSAG